MDGAEERIRQLEARLATVEAALSSLSGARSDAEKADAEIADLKMRVDGLEFREATGEDEGGGDGGGSDNEEQYGYPSALADSDAEYPFHVVYDDGDMDGEDEGKWKIYLPDGCVKVGNEEALFEGSESVVDRDADGYAEIVSPAETMYCNVRRVSAQNVWKFKIEDAPDSNASVHFKVVGFDAAGENASEVAVQYENGAVVIGKINAATATFVTGGSISVVNGNLVLNLTRASINSDGYQVQSAVQSVLSTSRVTLVSGISYNPSGSYGIEHTRKVVSVLSAVDTTDGDVIQTVEYPPQS